MAGVLVIVKVVATVITGAIVGPDLVVANLIAAIGSFLTLIDIWK